MYVSNLCIRIFSARLIQISCEQMKTYFNPLGARIFTEFGLIIRGQSVTHGNMGCNPPRYRPRNYQKVKFPGRDISSLAAEGLRNESLGFKGLVHCRCVASTPMLLING